MGGCASLCILEQQKLFKNKEKTTQKTQTKKPNATQKYECKN